MLNTRFPILTGTFFFASLAAYGQGVAESPLVASNPGAFARFGISAAVGGGHLVVGATGSSIGLDPAGAAYVFTGTTGQQQHKLVPSDGEAGDFFGQSLSVDGDLVLVGSPRNAGPSFFTFSGSAYLFDAATGQELAKFRADDEVTAAFFGRSVAIDGGLAVFGANGRNAQGTETGTTYVFDVTTGQQLHKLFAADGQFEDELGTAVALDGGLLVSTAVRDDDNGADSGSAYVFDAVTGTQLHKLLPADGEAGDAFGESVAMDGQFVVIGAMRDNDNGENSGSAYVFDATTGQQITKLLATDGALFDNFGQRVAISGGRVFVGAPRHDDGGNGAGAVYVFDRDSGQEIAKILASDGAADHFFGYGLAASGDVAVVGSPFADVNGSSAGLAYRLDVSNLAGGLTSFCSGNSNSISPDGAILTNTGGFGTAQASFSIVNVPNSFGILFVGDATTSVMLGCGTRCVGGNLRRGQVFQATGNQIPHATFDMSIAGATHIQYWYREGGSCSGGQNVSNALTN